MTQNLAFVFPGQGSQAVAMLAELAQTFSIVEETFQQASAILGYDAWQLAQHGPEEKLNQTQFTQPVLLAADVAVYRVWQQLNQAEPIYFAGHSLGEYAALVCAGAIDFADAIKLVAERGRLMQEAVPAGQGGMAAIIGLDSDKVNVLCQQAAEGQILSAANYNSPGQIVIAGHTDAVNRAVEQAKSVGAKKAKLLEVSVPSHCLLMQSAAEKFISVVKAMTWQQPKVAVVNNVDVAINNEVSAIQDALIRQLYMPVRWIEIIEYLSQQNVDVFMECGPGKVLAGLNKRITKDIATQSVIAESLRLALIPQ